MQIIQGGARVFYYQEDREATLDNSTDKILMSLKAFADEMEREQARKRTYAAMRRKAEAGHVTGGRTFGYDNIEVKDANGRRSHVVSRINEDEAAIVRRIFRLCAEGDGLTAISKRLNADGCLSPRSQRGRPRGWTASSVREVLHREKYKGLVVWDKTSKRNRWGAKRQQPRRPEPSGWNVHAPEIALSPTPNGKPPMSVSPPTGQRFGREVRGRTPGNGAKYLLTGPAEVQVWRRHRSPDPATRWKAGPVLRLLSVSAQGPRCVTTGSRSGVTCSKIRAPSGRGRRSEPGGDRGGDQSSYGDVDGDQQGIDTERLRGDLDKIERELVNCRRHRGGVDPTRCGRESGSEKRRRPHCLPASRRATAPDLATLERHLPKTLALWRKVLREPVDVADAAAILKKLIEGKLECSPAFNAKGRVTT